MTPARRAFTLIEILMVIALLGIVAGFAVTRFNYWGYRMDANIRLMQNAVIGAQQAAITRNVTVQVMFDASAQRVRILQDFGGAPCVVSGCSADVSDTVRYRPLADGAEFRTPPSAIDGAAVAYMTGPGVLEFGNPLQKSILIFPNGSVTGDAVVYIGSPRGRAEDFRAMTIVGATARTGFWSRGGGAWTQRER